MSLLNLRFFFKAASVGLSQYCCLCLYTSLLQNATLIVVLAKFGLNYECHVNIGVVVNKIWTVKHWKMYPFLMIITVTSLHFPRSFWHFHVISGSYGTSKFLHVNYTHVWKIWLIWFSFSSFIIKTENLKKIWSKTEWLVASSLRYTVHKWNAGNTRNFFCIDTPRGTQGMHLHLKIVCKASKIALWTHQFWWWNGIVVYRKLAIMDCIP